MKRLGNRVGAGLCALFAFGLTSLAAAQTPPAPDLTHGESVFQSRCSMCHSLDGPGQGPNLTGVVGRKAATSADFNYSEAMKVSGLTWTAPVLDRFLTDPAKMVPGSPMRTTVPDEAERRDLIAYLGSLKAP